MALRRDKGQSVSERRASEPLRRKPRRRRPGVKSSSVRSARADIRPCCGTRSASQSSTRREGTLGTRDESCALVAVRDGRRDVSEACEGRCCERERCRPRRLAQVPLSGWDPGARGSRLPRRRGSTRPSGSRECAKRMTSAEIRPSGSTFPIGGSTTCATVLPQRVGRARSWPPIGRKASSSQTLQSLARYWLDEYDLGASRRD